jgi:uncharacterized protein
VRVSFLVPAYNEAATIEEVLRRVGAVPFDKQIIVVDDGSTNGTAGGPRPLGRCWRWLEGRTPAQPRQGAAIRVAIQHVDRDIAVIQDADLEYDPADVPALIEPIERGVADVVFGSRLTGGRPQRAYLSGTSSATASSARTASGASRHSFLERGSRQRSQFGCQHSWVEVLEVDSPSGPARVYLHAVDRPRAWLLLGHGAGGGVEAPDLVAAREAALQEGVGVGLVEQPYRVKGRRSPAPAGQLDAAWVAVVSRLSGRELAGLPLLVGGRSSGARVACRTSATTDAVAVVCLAFPLRPPRRAGKPAPSRLSELDAVVVPTLVVQGTRDPYGIPPAGARRTVVEVQGDHSLKGDLPAVSAAVKSWLAAVLASRASKM